MRATAENIDLIFTYHKPFGTQPERYNSIRTQAHTLASVIIQNCPPSEECTLAIRRLQEAVMWANAAIALNENPAE